jgi:hypothetical protein
MINRIKNEQAPQATIEHPYYYETSYQFKYNNVMVGHGENNFNREIMKKRTTTPK